MCEVLVDKGLQALAAKNERADRLVTLARKRYATLVKTYPKRQPEYDYQQARLLLAGGDTDQALASVTRCLAQQKDDARFRRLRLAIASADPELQTQIVNLGLIV